MERWSFQTTAKTACWLQRLRESTIRSPCRQNEDLAVRADPVVPADPDRVGPAVQMALADLLLERRPEAGRRRPILAVQALVLLLADLVADPAALADRRPNR
jgi:hypothetical protein